MKTKLQRRQTRRRRYRGGAPSGAIGAVRQDEDSGYFLMNLDLAEKELIKPPITFGGTRRRRTHARSPNRKN